jgi:molybdopterin-guanine dinucleotide biosynthesis protein A
VRPGRRGGVSAIVLAGGRARRFGSDKLRADLAGRPLVEHAIAGVAAVATDIVVVVGAGDERMPPAGPITIRTVTDREAGGGPLVGLVAGLEAAAEPIALVVAGDMPTLDADVLDLLVRRLLGADSGIAAIALEFRGRLEPMPTVVRTGAATDVARQLVLDGVRSLRSLYERLPTRLIDEAAWRPLDPHGATLRDVDRPDDLERLGTPEA